MGWGEVGRSKRADVASLIPLACCSSSASPSPLPPATSSQILQWLLPDWLPSRWLSLFTQPWEGDVTMTLPMHMWDLNKALINPTHEELERLIKVREGGGGSEILISRFH